MLQQDGAVDEQDGGDESQVLGGVGEERRRRKKVEPRSDLLAALC